MRRKEEFKKEEERIFRIQWKRRRRKEEITLLGGELRRVCRGLGSLIRDEELQRMLRGSSF